MNLHTLKLSTLAILALAFAACGDSGDSATSTSTSQDQNTTTTSNSTLTNSYVVVDTNQTICYDSSGVTVTCAGSGQDGAYTTNTPSYTVEGTGTVTDNVTGLMWQQTADTNGDGTIDSSDKMNQSTAEGYCGSLSLGGYDDWQLPSIKQLYSLVLFSGTDPVSVESIAIPFLDSSVFGFGYGDTAAGERLIDAQWATTTLYVSTVMDGQSAMFGYNFADGRIKGYGVDSNFYVYCVRNTQNYGENNFSDNGDGTISDSATSLMWQQNDSGNGMDWDSALSYCENASTGGYSDWKLPDAKALQSIVDYSRSPDTTDSAAINAIFNATSFTDEAAETDWGFYWASTTHAQSDGTGEEAVYVAFGRALGYMNGSWMDVHGAGAQRSDPKVMPSDTSQYTAVTTASGETAYIDGPQGDVVRVYNYVRCVRSE